MKKNTIIKDSLILFVITLIAGISLGFVYDITKKPIAAAEGKAKQEAYQKVFQDTKQFAENSEISKKVDVSDGFFKDKNIEGVEIKEVLEAKDTSDEIIGYVMSVVATQGYGGDITFSLGIDKNGSITGFQVLSMSETAGLGAKCTQDAFKEQFAGIQAKEITYTKTGKSAPNEIDALSGATITTSAVTKAVNGALAFAQEELGLTITQ